MRPANLLLLILFIPCFGMGQNTYKLVLGSGDQFPPKVLTSYRPGKLIYKYRNCHFTIKAGKWVERNSKYLLAVTATLSNDSNDTLIYEWDSDFWRDHFKIDTTYLKIDDPIHHISDIDGSDIVLPHKSMSYEIELTPKNNSTAFHGGIKVGVRLLIQRRPGSDTPLGIVDGVTSKRIINKYERDGRKRTHILWSNMVDI